MWLVSRALGGQAQPSLLVTIGAKISGDGHWALHNGTKRDDNTPVSIFVCDLRASPQHGETARNALKRAKTIRHPDCLRFVDGSDSELAVVIATELVVPLSVWLSKSTSDGQKRDVSLIRLGLYKLASALKFITEDCSLRHGLLTPASVFATRSGEWKLGSFDLLSPADHQSLMSTSAHLLPADRFIAPEHLVSFDVNNAYVTIHCPPSF